MNTQKKTQDEKARKRLMEVARSGKSLMPRMGGGGPLMPQYAIGGSISPQDYLNLNYAQRDAVKEAPAGMNPQEFLNLSFAERDALTEAPAGAFGKSQAVSKISEQEPQWMTTDAYKTLYGLGGAETKKPSAQGYNPGLNLNGSMDKERIGGFGQYANSPSATLPGYAGGGRLSGWNVDRAAQIAATENAAMGQPTRVVPQQAMAPAQGGGMELSEGEQYALEANRAREAEQAAAQKPAWKKMLGMARGGPLMPPVWDGRKGGEVPPGPEGVDTVPAITQAGPVMLDSQMGPGRQEYVLTPEMVDALGGAGELDVLRQALGGQPMCGEGMACGGGRGVPKMAEGGGRDVTNPYLLRKAEEAQQAFIASHGPTYRGVGIEPFVQAEVGKLRNPPPPTTEQRQAAPIDQPPAMMPAVEVPLMPPAAPSVMPQKGPLPTDFSRTLLPDGTAQYSDEKGNFLEGPAQKTQGTFSTYSSKPVMEAAKAEKDLAIAQQWYSLKPSERGRMPDYVAEALGKPYARPQTPDQVWAAAQRQQTATQAQAEQARQAKIQEEIVKGEYGVKAAEAKAQDEASKYEVEYKQNPFSGEVVPSYKFKGRGPIPEGSLMPAAPSAQASKMPTLTPKQQHYWGQYEAEKNPAKKAAMRTALVEMFPELADLVGAQGVR